MERKIYQAIKLETRRKRVVRIFEISRTKSYDFERKVNPTLKAKKASAPRRAKHKILDTMKECVRVKHANMVIVATVALSPDP